MAAFSLVIHPAAVAEAQAAFSWYRERSIAAAQAFMTEMDRAVSRLTEKPQIWPQYSQGTQYILLRRFPFRIIFRQTATRI